MWPLFLCLSHEAPDPDLLAPHQSERLSSQTPQAHHIVSKCTHTSDTLRDYLGHNPAAFEFILLAGKELDSKDFDAVFTQENEGLNALYQFMQVEQPSN